MTAVPSAWLKVHRIDPGGSAEWRVMLGEKELLRLDPGQAASVVVNPGPLLNLAIDINGRLNPMRGLSIADGATLQLEVRPLPRTTLQKLFGQPPSLRADMTDIPPEPPRTVTAQFWAGTADSKPGFWDVFAERQFPEPQTDEEQWAQDDTPISLFAELQGELFIDHDFTEGAYVGDEGTWAERVKGHSWSASWAAIVEARAKVAGHEAPNVFWMVVVDERPGKMPDPGVRRPVDIEVPGLRMAYLGEITFPG